MDGGIFEPVSAAIRYPTNLSLWVAVIWLQRVGCCRSIRLSAASYLLWPMRQAPSSSWNDCKKWVPQAKFRLFKKNIKKQPVGRPDL